MLGRTKTTLLAAATALTLGAIGAQAQTCGGIYEVQRGDTLSQIATKLYENSGRWTLIFQANSSRMSSPNVIRVGQRLNVPCVEGLPVGLAGGVSDVELTSARPLQVPLGDGTMPSRINILTGDDRLPWSDRNLPQGGMMTELVTAAMDAAAPEGGYQIHWVNDWDAHFEPLMSNAFFDAGFPWFKPDCEDVPEEYKCQNIAFSAPVFEALVLLFVRAEDADDFATDAAMEGKTLCRPKGFSTFLLNQHGRKWESDGMVDLERPLQSDECFEMLVEGEVDAIVINEFHGRKSLARLGLKERVVVADAPPVSVQGLRVAVHKDLPDAEELVALIDEGIAKIQGNGTHSEIVTRHLTRIWSHY